MSSEKPLSFVKGLFFGHLASELVHPHPRPGIEERETMAMVLDSFRQFAADSLDGARFDEEHQVPAEVRRGLAELGMLGLTVPEEHGGAGLGYSTYCRVLEECNRHCASTAVILGGHQSIGIKAVLLHGTEEQKAQWLPPLAAGEWLAAFALSEPQAGSDPGALETQAVPTEDGDGYVLTGQKIWCTNGGFADFITVFAKTPAELDGGTAGDWRITCFGLTPEDLTGEAFRRGVDEDKLGLRGSSTTQLFFDGLRVPGDRVIGPRGRGLKVAFEVLNYGRTSLAAGCAGSSKAILEHAARHAAERVQFERPIAEFELIQAKLAEMMADTYATESMAYLTAAMADRGDADFSLEAAACKVFGTEAHWRTCNHAVQIAGGIAYVREYPYERFLRDARINMIFEGTNEILHHFIALQGLRVPGELAAGLGGDAARLGEGVLRAAAGARLSGDRGDGTRFGPAHEAIADRLPPLEAAAADLGIAVERALARHGRSIVDRQLVQERLAECAMHLFAGFAVASRIDAVVGEAGAEASADELTVARQAMADAARRARAALAALQDNDDGLIGATARVATTRLPWAWDAVP